MSVIAVNLLFSGLGSSSSPQKQTYVDVFQVLLDAPTSNQAGIENHYLLPFYGAFFRGNPLALCVSKSATPDPDTRLKWTVTVNYETQDKDKDDDQKDENGDQSDNPLDWRDQWEFIGNKSVIPFTNATMQTDGVKVRKKGSQGPVVNSCGDVIDPPPERDFTTYILRVTKFVKSVPYATFIKYQDSINSDTFKVSKPGLRLTILPFTAKFEPPQTSLNYHQPRDGVEIAYVKLTYELAISELDWRIHELNRGFNRRQDEGDKDDNGRDISPSDFMANDRRARKAPIKDMDGLEVNVPVLLDLDGQPLKPGADPIYLDYSGYAELPFAPLKI